MELLFRWLGVTKNQRISQKGGSFEPNEPPLDPPLNVDEHGVGTK